MTTAYPRRDTSSSDPGPLLGAILAIIFILAALPAIIIGMIIHRFFSWLINRYIPNLSWRWSLLFWFLLAAISLYYTNKFFWHGLQPALQQEVADYTLAAKHYQLDFEHWPWRSLWPETWPIWLRTLGLFPVATFIQEISTDIHHGNTERIILQQERRRQGRVRRAQNKARKRTKNPGRVPNSAGGGMVMGVPIKDDEQE